MVLELLLAILGAFRLMKSLFLVLFLISSTSGAANLACQNLFDNPELERSIYALAELRLKLDIAKINNQNNLATTALHNEYSKKESRLIDHLEKYQIMSKDELFLALKLEVAKVQNKVKEDKVEKEIQRVREMKSKPDGFHMIFNRVEPRNFSVYYWEHNEGKRQTINVSKPFEMMATQTTYYLWHKVNEIAKIKIDQTLVLKDYDESWDRRPIESISFQDIGRWIINLNDLSKRGEESLFELIPDHKNGDTYRLPTYSEWRSIAWGDRRFAKFSHQTDPLISEFDRYFWHNGNSEQKSHPVATKDPFVVDGNNFFDFMGNVSEWVDHDDPKSFHNTHQSVGGNYNYDTDYLVRWENSWMPDNYQTYYLGFRLVRERGNQ